MLSHFTALSLPFAESFSSRESLHEKELISKKTTGMTIYFIFKNIFSPYAFSLCRVRIRRFNNTIIVKVKI
jgi:hypothetical protein